MINLYLGGRGQRGQCHPSVWMDLLCDHQSKFGMIRLKEQTLAMPSTTVLKTLRGSRYTLLMVSNCVIAAFAMSILLTAVSAGPGMDLTVDICFSAS